MVTEREREREKAIETQKEGKLHWGEVGALGGEKVGERAREEREQVRDRLEK